MKNLKAFISLIFLIIGMLIFSIGYMFLIGYIQTKLILPKEGIMWIFKYPIRNLAFIHIIFGFIYFSHKGFREFILRVIKSEKKVIKRHKKSFISIFIILNIVLIYTILFDVTLITNNKIIDYTFLSPQGKEYEYNDIVKIDTGVYGKKLNLPFAHYSTGDFYYIIQFNDGTKINLTDVGGTNNDEDENFIIEKLDSQFVNSGIFKVSSMNNFEYCTKNLGKIYTDKIRKILLNIK